MKILSIGINTMDIYRQYGRMYPGGNEYNIAYHVKKLGGEASFMGVFARDKAGEYLRKLLVDIGVDISHSRYEEGSSGYAIVDIVDGDRVFVDWNRHGVTDKYPFEITEDEIKYAAGFDMVCVSHNSRLTTEKVKRLGSGSRLCYDLCDDFTKDELFKVAPYLEIAYLSASHLKEDEITSLLSDVHRAGCPLVVATLGAKGSMAFDGSSYYRQDCNKVRIVDTMGAGDSFLSAFLVSYLSPEKRNNIPAALLAGARYADEIVQMHGSLGIGFDIDISKMNQYFNI